MTSLMTSRLWIGVLEASNCSCTIFLSLSLVFCEMPLKTIGVDLKQATGFRVQVEKAMLITRSVKKASGR